MKNSISFKFLIFGGLLSLIMFIMGYYKYNTIKHAGEEFTIFKEKAVDGKFYVLEIEKETNYISRLTRDIMLGNDYDGNLKKLYDSKSKIKESYIGLEKTVKNTPNEKEKLDEVNKSLNNTIAFIDDGINKMESIKNIDRTPEVLSKLYQDYKKSATPLANANRETFSKLVKTKEAGLEKRTKELNNEMNKLLFIMLIESMIIMLIVLISLFTLNKNIKNSLNKFKIGLTSFFDFLNNKSNDVDLIKLNSNDEF